MADESQQPRSDAQSDSDDECDEPVAGTAFSDYVALSTEDDAARRRPRDATQAADAWRRGDATAAPALGDDALRRPRVIKPPPPPESEELPRPRPTSVRFVPQRPPCKSLRELALDTLSAHAELIPTDAVDALDEATAADVVRWIMAKQKLTTSIAQRFMASRHVELSRALGELDLVAGVSTYGDGYCPRLSRGPGM
jgi:hypothetical protein